MFAVERKFSLANRELGWVGWRGNHIPATEDRISADRFEYGGINGGEPDPYDDVDCLFRCL